MQSVQKNVAIPATLRVSARQRDDGTATYFDADITKALIGDGIVSLFKQTPKLLLDPAASYEDLFLSIRNARVVMNTTTAGNLTSASEPSGANHVFSGANVIVKRLDTTGQDVNATIEFRVPQDTVLPQINGADVVYSRAYLMATLYQHQYQTKPVLNNDGQPAVVVTNTGAETFNAVTDLYIVPGDGGSSITVGGGITEKTDVTCQGDTAGSLLGKYFTLASPTRPYYAWYREMISALPEVTDIDCESDVAGALNNKYWVFDTPSGGFFVWYNVAGTGSAPSVPGRSGVQVNITMGASATDVATATAAALDNLAAVISTNVGPVVTMTNSVGGAVDNATDGNTAWTAAWTVTQQGTNVSYTADPMVAAKTGIPITISRDDSANEVATATRAVLHNMGDFSATVLSAVVSISNTSAGNVTDAGAGNTGWAAPAVTEQGSAAIGDALFLDRRALIGDAVSSEDVVLGIVEFRTIVADDITDDLMRGSATSQCEMVFRLVV